MSCMLLFSSGCNYLILRPVPDIFYMICKALELNCKSLPSMYVNLDYFTKYENARYCYFICIMVQYLSTLVTYVQNG